MAGTIRCISKFNINILNKVVKQQLIYNGSRALYDEASLGLDNYKSTRKIVMEKYKIGLDSFKIKMQESIVDEKSMIFTEDLKSTLHLVEKDDIQLLVSMLEKYNSQNSQVRFGTFKFGPVVMRTLYYLNEPDVAMDLFLNSKYDEFFNQMSTFMLIMDLLYENKKYADVRTIYDKVKQKFVNGIRHPKLVINIVAVACYKENTQESLNYGLNICKDLDHRGSIPLRKVIAALGALALNLKSPEVALELVALSRTVDYISIRCIRIMALADLGRIDEIVIVLKSCIQRGIPEKNGFYTDIISRIQETIKRLKIGEDHEICNLIKVLQSQGYITPMTLDEHLTQKIKTQPKESEPSSRRYQNSSWSESSSEINDYERQSRQGNTSF
ncbi:hypothetical protein G9C98_001220 [Cotesia typhae]|uniref:Pentatricopeptide repeat-containing protein 2 n=1 Tax=Cotesia typhae TaxID=2053667 RepID=A0A8J5QX43_9HYME|nr:hypothetical protein G9C98_001220 [Cotesia typhae]